MKRWSLRLKKREPLTIAMVLFFASVILGCIFSKVSQGLLQNSVDSLNSRYFNTIKSMEINYGDFFRYIFTSKLKPFFLFWTLSLTFLGLPYMGWYLLSRGFQVGYLMMTLWMHYGMKGGLLYLAYLFPQELIFVPVVLISIKNCFALYMEANHDSTSGLQNVLLLKKYIKLIIILIVCILIGACMEAFVGSYLVKKTLQLF
ncbi:stage II sporulation protein M [Lachnoclostridium sp.]|uniref:stage II sporulation protein M n=1 Tax=Lachnoclostridium sp. TaxID=2028282 RepID=UPI0028A04A12|nr:stage II sporulation protein M [Lachnoclostridium sp.]